METNKSNLDDRIALIHADLQKIIKHFKLDRRSKNNSDDLSETENANEESDKLLKEILERIGEISKIDDRKEFTVEQVAKLEKMLNAVASAITKGQSEYHKEFEITLERIEQALEVLKAKKQDSIVEHYHRHTIDIGSSKVFLSMIVMVLTILGLSYSIGEQRRTIGQFQENNLKYRYIKMYGGASAGDIEALERVFTYDRNADSVRLIRQRVEQYERLVKEQVEKIEQARLNASEAERLQNQAETVKKGK